MRFALFVLLSALSLAGCGETSPHRGYIPDPDASTCGIGAFQIAAPKPDLHYAPNVVVYVDETELWAELTLDMTDDLGTTYAWNSDGTEPYPGDAAIWWNRDSFSYQLPPSRRMTLTVSHCQDAQSVTFFTSAQ
jgi:hypothetical protein